MMLTQFVFYHFSFYHRFALNENPEKTWSNLFSCGGIGCESLADEQLLLHVSFQQVVKLKKLYIGVPSDDRCPNTIKLFVNEGNSISFDLVSAQKPIQVIQVTPGSDMVEIALAPLKFNKVQTISIFIEDNNGDDVSFIRSVSFEGATVQSMDVSNFSKNC